MTKKKMTSTNISRFLFFSAVVFHPKNFFFLFFRGGGGEKKPKGVLEHNRSSDNIDMWT